MPDFEIGEASALPLGPGDLLDKPVYDLDGRLLGRVRLCREVAGRLASFDVELAPKARRALHVLQDVAPLDPADVVAAGEAVTLRESGEALLRPEGPHGHPAYGERG